MSSTGTSAPGRRSVDMMSPKGTSSSRTYPLRTWCPHSDVMWTSCPQQWRHVDIMSSMGTSSARTSCPHRDVLNGDVLGRDIYVHFYFCPFVIMRTEMITRLRLHEAIFALSICKIATVNFSTAKCVIFLDFAFPFPMYHGIALNAIKRGGVQGKSSPSLRMLFYCYNPCNTAQTILFYNIWFQLVFRCWFQTT